MIICYKINANALKRTWKICDINSGLAYLVGYKLTLGKGGGWIVLAS